MSKDSTLNNDKRCWYQYIGSIWANFILNHAIDKKGCIVELGPGYTNKIGIGLSLIDFCGTFYVVEPNREALLSTVSNYRKMIPSATIIPVCMPISAAMKVLPKNVDCMLMNHLLDDLILHSAIPSHLSELIFGNILSYQENCQQEVKSIWKQLLSTPDYLNELANKVLEELLFLISYTDPVLLGASQYNSWFLELHGLKEVNDYSTHLLQTLSRHLGKTSNQDSQMLLDHGQNPNHWLLINRGESREVK